MIIQITRTKNEAFLLKEMMPIWSKYADGFIFYDDGSIDGTAEFLESNKKKYNIIEVLKGDTEEDYIKKLKMETDERQLLYDTAFKYSNKIICCDSDEYLDGSMDKSQLDQLLNLKTDCVFHLQWVQYTDENIVRVDGPWGYNFKARIGSYTERGIFETAQMHSLHIPTAGKAETISPDQLFIAHAQWLSKRWVGVKQYFWKINDYVNKTVHNAEVIDSTAYDVSVNNFEWQYDHFPVKLKINKDIYDEQDIKNNYKLEYIKKYTRELNIPNLGDWGMGIYDFCVKE